MYLTNKHRKQFALFYLLCFIASNCWYAYYHLLLSQANPVFFVNRLDITGNILMLTDLQHLLIENYWLRQLFDIVYLLLPFLLYYAVLKEKKITKLLVVLTCVSNLVYTVFVAEFTYISLDLFLAWLLIPFVFFSSSNNGFYYCLHCLRLVFVMVFFSAGIWKLRGEGLFNMEQMGGILLMQHKQYLAGNDGDWFTQLNYFLIEHKVLSYILYLFGALAELVFVIGFFTRKYDRLLLIAFLLFVIADYFLMRINYISWVAFGGLLYFSKFNIEKDGV